MPDLSTQDRLQPSLLDRLLDLEPRAQREAREQRVLSRQQLRAAVLRDLGWLFNATRAEPGPGSPWQDEVRDWAANPQAQQSVLNFGMPAISGATLSSLDLRDLERQIREAIQRFEPRIESDSLEVEVVKGSAEHNTMQLVIRGRMWAQPVPLELMLSADIDVETGTSVVRDLRA